MMTTSLLKYVFSRTASRLNTSITVLEYEIKGVTFMKFNRDHPGRGQL